MAATTVEKGGVRKSAGSRSSLSIPYTVTWPTLEKKASQSIMNAIGRHFPAILSQKTIPKGKRKHLESPSLTEADKILIEQMTEKETLRKCLAVGINEVTKGLEKNKLALVLVDRSVKPAMMTDHLLLLGATRQTPTAGLHELGELIGPLLHYKKAAAIGFKRERPSPYFDTLIEYIIERVPEIVIPWLKPFADRSDDAQSNSKESLTMIPANENKESKDRIKPEQLKRKLRESPETEDPASKSRRLVKEEKEDITTKTHDNTIADKILSTSDSCDDKNKNTKEKQSIDFGIIMVNCQSPIIKTVEKGKNKQKENKKKKKKKKDKI